jgi:putative intracellular protease/amidase
MRSTRAVMQGDVMSKTAVLVLTSQEEYGNSGMRCGSWLEELAQPYYALKDAGHTVVLASIRGGAAPLDPLSLEPQWLSAVGRRFLDDAAARAQLAATPSLEEVAAREFAAVVLVGGTGGTWDFPRHAPLTRLIERVNARNGVVAGICHGVIGLADARGADGLPLVRGRKVTSISNAEDEIMGADKIVPALPEDALRRLGSFYLAAPPFAANVVQDGNLITAQNPASAESFGEALVARLG